MQKISEYLRITTQSLLSVSQQVKEEVLERIEQGNILRSEDPITHFCVYFVPFIKLEKKVFLGHHTKANSWIAPGGHIEPEHTTPIDTIMQEASEELGVTLNQNQISQPFFLSVKDVNAPNRACRRHYSLWYAILFEKEEKFTIEEREFYDTKWLTLLEAEHIVISQENLDALTLLKTIDLA